MNQGEGDFGLECRQEEKKLAGIFLLFDFLFRLEIEGVGGDKNFFVIVGSVFKWDDQDVDLFAIFFAICSFLCADGGLKRSNSWYSSPERY